MRKIFISLFGLFVLTTCGPQVKFTQPQPKDGKNLSYIPVEYYGKYLDTSDSSFLEIDSVSVTTKWLSKEIIPRDSIAAIEKELELTIKRDTQICLTEKRGNWLSNRVNVDVQFIGDSVKIDAIAENRMFEISDSQLVRKYRGFCFLNTQTPEGVWLVKVLCLKDNKLDFDDILDSEQSKKLKGITRVAGPIDSAKNEPSEYYLNPSRRELRRILRVRNSSMNFIKQ
ncbi:MAG: hypothetical protein AB7S48_08825 [Bacteroidales bacterium]